MKTSHAAGVKTEENGIGEEKRESQKLFAYTLAAVFRTFVRSFEKRWKRD